MSPPLSDSPRAHSRRIWRLSWLDRAIGLLPWILGALFGAVALHLLIILALPAVWPGGAYRALALRLPLGEKLLLPRADSASRDPAFSDPFAAVAICRFDLSRGPLRLRADADGDHPFSLSVRLADGTIIYSANDRQTPQGKFDVLIVTQAQADAQDSKEESKEDVKPDGAQDSAASASAAGAAGDAVENELRLVSPGARGFAVFRVLSLRYGDYDAAAAARAEAQCQLEKPTP
ncbi:MAG TPA: hypothetical protein VMU18_10180 [Rhodoblastus sp.]|nr:hypothetical protein [Rhodoblastus sp.]